jgi:DNA repair photolyase
MDFKWSLNPYMGCAHRCTFCYVRGFERRADRPSDDRYGESVRVKVNVAQVLAAELARPSWSREEVVIGAATDPYQPVEGRYRLTRACLRVLIDHRTPFSIITRGPLIVRDLDLLAEASHRVAVSVNVSVPTLDERVWRTTEPGTAPPLQRLRAVRMMRDRGIRAGVAMAPILPGLSDSEAAMATVVRAAREAGAAFIWADYVNLRPGTREHFLDHLARDWPDELPRYLERYAGRAYLPDADRKVVRDRLHALKRSIPAPRHPVPLLEPPLPPEQLDLAI